MNWLTRTIAEFKGNWQVKFLALGLSLLLWFYLKYHAAIP